MFYINKETPLSDALLHKLINQFQTTELPKLKRWGDYYNGIQKILNKSYSDPTKECNHIITNMCKTIVDTYAGYICGKPITYTSNSDIEDVQNIINYNDSSAEDYEWLSNSLIYSVGYELYWIDAYSQVRYSQISPLCGFPIYDNSLDQELLYFVRWYKEDSFNDNDNYFVEVYDKFSIKVYKSIGLNGAFTPIEEKAHYFKDVPVSVFWLNTQEQNIFNSIISLQDAYNDLQSGEIDSFNAWVDSYLVLTNCDAGEDDLRIMKENRTILLPESSTATFLTKNVSDTQISNMLENIRKNIYKITACPDTSDEVFMAQSGEAIKWKLTGFENVASGIVAKMTKAIQKRIELICNILNLKATDAIWRDIDIQFTRNLPTNNTELISLVQNLQGIVSNETLLSLLPFVKDTTAELEKLNQEKQSNMALYGFGLNTETTDEETDVE